MFGIGLPEMILILALALIVVGPDKLPDLARSAAKGLMELKKTAEGLKQSLVEEGNPLDDIKPDLEEAAKNLKNNLLDAPPYQREDKIVGLDTPEDNAAKAYQELVSQTGGELDQSQEAATKATNPPVEELANTQESSEQTESSSPQKSDA